MGGKHRKCTVCNASESRAETSNLLFAAFPLDETRCKQWIKVVGIEELVHLPVEKLNQLRFVCGKHFERKDFNKKGNRLKKRAIPKLNLTAVPLTEEQLIGFPQHVAKTQNVVQPEMIPSTSTSTFQTKPKLIVEQHQNVVQPEIPSTSTSIIEQHQNVVTPRRTEPKRAEKRKIEDNIEITPRKKKLIEKLNRTKCTLASLKKSAKLIENLDSPILKEFVTSAFKNQNRKPKGRRWTTMNKISALAIFKRSPKAYRYLEHIMPLPSIKTLNNVLRKIPMAPGINESVLNHLKTIAGKKNEKDKLCGLVFDEIALKPRAIYNMATDQIDGYQDMGNSDSRRCEELADHALVFMIQGIHVKFKQPIAFYFVTGTVSSQKLAVIIKEIIQAVSETGFNIITTICDQGPTNMGALNLLKNFSGPDRDPESENYFVTDNKKNLYHL